MSAVALSRGGVFGGLIRSAAMPLLCVMIVGATAAYHLLSSTNTDVSWLLTVGERWAAGETPYVGTIEVNPPASVLLYMPAIALGRLLGVSPEAGVIALVILAALASAVLTCRVLQRAELLPTPEVGWQGAALLALLLLVPAGDFAEREHIALLAILPLLAVLSARVIGRPPAWRDAALAGLGGGIALAIKPLFGLGLLGPLVYVIARRGWRHAVSAPELHFTWGVAALYGACIPVWFPHFLSDVLHWVLVAYVPVRRPAFELLASPIGLVFAALCIVAFRLSRLVRFGAWPRMLLLSAIGFHAAYILQGKPWAYHALPGVLLAALAVLAVVCGPQGGFPWNRSRVLATAALSAITLVGAILFAAHNTMGAAIPGLEQALAEVAPHPTVMALTSDISIGHPLVREVAGRWVGTFPAEWTIKGAETLRDRGVSTGTDQELQALSDAERVITTQDVVFKQPDAILVQGPRWQRYIEENPELAAAFQNYERRGDYGRVTLWARRRR